MTRLRMVLITEGISEYQNLPKLFPQLHQRCSNQFVKILKVSVSPDAPVGVLARECAKTLKIATALRANLVVILLDREQQQAPVGSIALGIEAAVIAKFNSSIMIKVVLKDRCFENWLISDLDALYAQPARFKITKGMAKKIQPNKADSCDATGLLKTATGNTYNKIGDSSRICDNLDVARAALHSRSFRHFLHVIHDPTYASQCKIP